MVSVVETKDWTNHRDSTSSSSSLLFTTRQRRMMSRKAVVTMNNNHHHSNKLLLSSVNRCRSKSTTSSAAAAANKIRNNGIGGGRCRNNNNKSIRTRSATAARHRKQQKRQKATLAPPPSSSQASSSSCVLIRDMNKGLMEQFRLIRNNAKELLRFHRERLNLWLNEPRVVPIPRWISPRQITYKIVECFGHGSFVLVAISYAVDDHLNLRLLAIMGSSAMLFSYFHPHGRILWLPFKWNCIFVALNSWRVAKVFLDKYRSENQLSASLSKIYDDHFYVLEKNDFAKLVRLGTIEKCRKGDIIVQQDSDSRYVRLVIRGELSVDRDGQTTYLLHEGQFISEMGLHAGLGLRGTVKSCCSVKAASEDVELVRWDRTELMHLLELHKSIERAIRAVMSWDIVSKLKSQRVLLASGKIHDPERWTKKRREQSIARYQAILQNMLVHPDYLNTMKDQLTKYREIHQITYSDHIAALNDIGWTIDEFNTGIKEGQLDADQIDFNKLGGYKWWFRSWWKAL